MDAVTRKELTEKVLIHLYNSAVSGSVKSTALAVGMKEAAWATNPRFEDLRALYELAGNDRRLFYSGAAAIAEFAAYRILDFGGDVQPIRRTTQQGSIPPRLVGLYERGPRWLAIRDTV